MTTSGVNVARAAATAGFKGKDLVTAVAIAYAESSFNEKATNHNKNGSTDYGLWQINSSHNFPELSSGAWQDPATNARMAHQVFVSQGWNAWSTHHVTNPIGFSRFQAALIPAAVFVEQATGQNPLSTAGSVTAAGVEAVPGVSQAESVVSTAQGAAVTAGRTLQFVTSTQGVVRIAKGLIGGTLVIVGANILVRGSVIAPIRSTVVQNIPAVGTAVRKIKAGGTK